MKHRTTQSTQSSALALAAVLAAGMAGCKTATVDDGTLTANVQHSIVADWSLIPHTIQVSTQSGVVTLTGGVENSAARTLAARDAAAVPGVVKVVNALNVTDDTAPVNAKAKPSPTQKLSTAPIQRAETTQPMAAAPITRSSALPPSPPAPPQPSAPPLPATRTVTLPAGSALPIRITQTLDSETTQPGDSFSGAIATDIVVDGMVMIPRGAPVSGRVTEVHEAAHFKGSSLLTLELTNLTSRGERISFDTEPYSVKGKGRGENTAVKAGVGAAAGAILGGIFGGGKGAAIGAAAGGGTGAGINAVTRGQQVQIPSESVVRFVTTSSIATRTSVHAGTHPDDGLQNR